MAKIVYNGCFGGFSLSDKAVRMYLDLKGLSYKEVKQKWGNSFQVEGGPHLYSRDIKRSDPILVHVVEFLGAEANGYCASLCIEEVDDGTFYRISEYDGMETVETQDSVDWEVA